MNQVYVVFKVDIVNPDTQEPLFAMGSVWLFDHVMKTAARYGVDHMDAYVCIGADAANKMVDRLV